MRLSFLQLCARISLFATVSLSPLQAYAISQPQQLSWVSFAPTKSDSLLLSHQIVIPVPQDQRDALVLYNLVQELHTLPVGKEYSYYQQVLEERGYRVLETYNDHRHWEFALEKTRQDLRLIITYNPETRRSIMIAASGPRVVDRGQNAQE